METGGHLIPFQLHTMNTAGVVDLAVVGKASDLVSAGSVHLPSTHKQCYYPGSFSHVHSIAVVFCCMLMP